MTPRYALSLVVLALAACNGTGGLGLGPPPTTSLPPQRAVTALPTPTVAPSATPRPTAPPTPTRTATPLPSTATPIPTLPLRITAQLDPPTPHAGEEFVLALTIANEGKRSAMGVFIATSGPWDRWTVLDIEPSGTFARDAAGWHVVSGIEVPAGDSRTLEVHVRANEPAQEQLTFAVREAEAGEVP